MALPGIPDQRNQGAFAEGLIRRLYNRKAHLSGCAFFCGRQENRRQTRNTEPRSCNYSQQVYRKRGTIPYPRRNRIAAPIHKNAETNRKKTPASQQKDAGVLSEKASTAEQELRYSPYAGLRPATCWSACRPGGLRERVHRDLPKPWAPCPAARRCKAPRASRP